MNRIHLGNRVFTEKHGKIKIAHGPYSGHFCPIVTYLRSFDGTRVHRFVHKPHELADFDHTMWMERRGRATNRLHASEIRASLAEPIAFRDQDTVPCTPVLEERSGTEFGVELHYDTGGRLSSASYGG